MKSSDEQKTRLTLTKNSKPIDLTNDERKVLYEMRGELGKKTKNELIGMVIELMIKNEVLKAGVK